MSARLVPQQMSSYEYKLFQFQEMKPEQRLKELRNELKPIEPNKYTEISEEEKWYRKLLIDYIIEAEIQIELYDK